MENNMVRLSGTVKRNSEASSGILDFSLSVRNNNGRIDIFDCRLTTQSPAYEQLEGFVNEGEPLEILGRLEKRTVSESQRLAGVWVDVRQTATVIYVEGIVESEE